MTTKTHQNDQNGIESHLPTELAFALLAHRRRRRTLRYLAGRVGAVPLTELADYLARSEADPSPNRTERMRVSLRHNHLPRLESAGVVTVDADRETVRLDAAAAGLARYLDLADVDRR
jgi:DNA-binding transcriptional ArsR family regulator